MLGLVEFAIQFGRGRMSTRLVNLAGILEGHDPSHEARLLILLGAVAQAEPVDGIMKLAKMDFLLRYPNVLERALLGLATIKPTAPKIAAKIPDEAKNTVEGRMIRFRYGPWDRRYRKWLAVLAAKQLVTVGKQGKTVRVALTARGKEVALLLAARNEFSDLAKRADMVRFAVGNMTATRLMKFVYQIAPEIVEMKWGENIKL